MRATKFHIARDVGSRDLAAFQSMPPLGRSMAAAAAAAVVVLCLGFAWPGQDSTKLGYLGIGLRRIELAMFRGWDEMR